IIFSSGEEQLEEDRRHGCAGGNATNRTPLVTTMSLRSKSSMLVVRRGWDLKAVPHAYSRLFDHAGRHSFFLSLPWFQNFERRLVSSDQSVAIYGVEEQELSNRPLGALVLRYNRESNGLFSPTVLESLSNYYTSYFEPILTPEAEKSAEIVYSLV